MTDLSLPELLELLDEGIVVLDSGGRIIATNGLARGSLGFKEARTFTEALAEKDSGPWLQVLELLSRQPAFRGELPGPTGALLQVFACARPDGGALFSLRAQGPAVTKERVSAAREEVLADHGIGLWSLDVQTGRLAWSPKCFELVGMEQGPIDTEAYMQRVHPDDQPGIAEAMAAAYAGEAAYSPCFRAILPDGQVRQLQDRCVVVERDAAGEPTMAVGATRDRTREAELELEVEALHRRLEALERLGVAGRLASTVAHDLNNVMTVVVGNVELLRDAETKADADPQEPLDDILFAARHASELAARLLDTVRMSPYRRRPEEAGAFLRKLESFLRSLVPETIGLSLSIPEGPLWTRMDRHRMEQVLYNLVLNSAQVSSPGGEVRVSLKGRASEVEFCVADDGPGIADDLRERLFEPFVTGREQGVGLGLASVKTIVDQHDGHIDVHSVVGEGARFVVRLPRSQAPNDDESSLPEAKAAPQRGAHVWVAEDQPLVRTFVQRVLEGAGHHVECFADPGRLIRALDETTQVPELVLSDVVMPVMSGPEMVQAILRRHPDVKVLYMSGYAEGMRDHQGLQLGSAPFLPKPFTARTLLSAVSSALGPAGPR